MQRNAVLAAWTVAAFALLAGAIAPARASAQGGALPSAPSLSDSVRAATLTAGELWFDAKATLGAFRGITRSAKGAISAAPSIEMVRGYVEFPAAGLTTDNGLRDKDMRKALEVDRFPVIRFDLDSVVVLDVAGDSARIELAGRMSIHGVTRAVRVPAQLRRLGGAHGYRVTGATDLLVPEYGITRLKRMLGMLSMNETVRLGIDVTFAPPPATPTAISTATPTATRDRAEATQE